jgi:dephospho-CoA kinase
MRRLRPTVIAAHNKNSGEGHMLRVGLTGGIGSGKSEVSSRLAAHGAVILDADVAARIVVEPGTPGLAQVVEAFGPEMLGPGGALDRAKMAALVFPEPERLAKLGTIVHPLVGQWMAAAEQAALETAGPSAVIVHAVPLLVEHGRAGSYDVVVVVDVPAELQIARLVARRGMSPGQARDRMAAQATRDQRLAVADLVIDNSGTLADLDHRADELWTQLTTKASTS